MARSSASKKSANIEPLAQIAPEQSARVIQHLVNNKGIDTGLAAEQMTPDQAGKLENFWINESGRIQIRCGTAVLGATSSSAIIHSQSYRRGDGNRYLVRWQVDKVQYFNNTVWNDFTGAAISYTADSVIFDAAWGPNKLLFAGNQSQIYELDFTTFAITLVAASPHCDGVSVFGGRVIAASPGTNYTRIQWCVKDNYTDWAGLGSGFEDLIPGPTASGDRVIGSFPVSDIEALVVRSDSIWIQTITGDSDVPFQFRYLFNASIEQKGKSICVAPSGLYAFGSNNVYQITAAGLHPIGDPIKNKYLRDIAQAYSLHSNTSIHAAYDEFRGVYYAYIMKSGTPTDSEVLVYSEKYQCWTSFKYPVVIGGLCVHNSIVDPAVATTYYNRGPVVYTASQTIYEDPNTSTDVTAVGTQSLTAVVTLAAQKSNLWNRRVKIERILIDSDGGTNGSYDVSISLFTPSRYDSNTFETIAYGSSTVVTNKLRTRNSVVSVYERDGIVPQLTFTRSPQLLIISIDTVITDGSPVLVGPLYNTRITCDLLTRIVVGGDTRIVS